MNTFTYTDTSYKNIAPTLRSPKNFGDYAYLIDISSNCDISSYIVYDPKYKMNFHNFKYYYNYFINCVNYVSITPDFGNYLYVFLMDTSNNIPLCKIGYTYFVNNREKSLTSKLKLDLKLLCIMPVNGEYEEIKLHNYLKIKCPYCIMDYKYPNKTKAEEIYRIHPNLFHELYHYVKTLEKNNTNRLLLVQEKTKQVELTEKEKTKQEQYKTKQEQEKTKQVELVEKTKQIELVEKTKQLELVEKTKQEKEKTKQLELQLKILMLQQNKITL